MSLADYLPERGMSKKDLIAAARAYYIKERLDLMKQIVRIDLELERLEEQDGIE
jgi:hypothetical protein